jgi:hypothetical protein
MKTAREKRRHARAPIESVTVEVYSPGGGLATPEVCSILNLSESGMLFESSRQYAVSQSLRLTFMLPDTIVIVRTNGQVVHSHKEGPRRCAGVRFVKLGVPEHNIVRRFVQTVLEKEEHRSNPRVPSN